MKSLLKVGILSLTVFRAEGFFVNGLLINLKLEFVVFTLFLQDDSFV